MMSPVSPKISGSSAPAAQATNTCGSDSSSALSSSISAFSVTISWCDVVLMSAALLRARTNMTVATTAKPMSPTVNVSVAICW